MLVLAGNKGINNVADIRDKVVGAQDFSEFAGAFEFDTHNLRYHRTQQVSLTGTV